MIYYSNVYGDDYEDLDRLSSMLCLPDDRRSILTYPSFQAAGGRGLAVAVEFEAIYKEVEVDYGKKVVYGRVSSLRKLEIYRIYPKVGESYELECGTAECVAMYHRLGVSNGDVVFLPDRGGADSFIHLPFECVNGVRVVEPA